MNNLRTIVLIAVLTLLLASAAMAAPRLTIPVKEFNFGYVPQNSTISHKFWLVSTGEDTLKILKVVPG